MIITIKTKYIVYNHKGTGVRHHHFTEDNTIQSFPDQLGDDKETGNRDAYAPAKFAFNQDEDLYFAYMTITGTRAGNILVTQPGSTLYQTGSSPVINILAVYAPIPTSGTGQPAVWVDAVNVDSGTFSDDLHFIAVLTPPQHTLDTTKTTEANQEGDILMNTPETILASDTIDNGVPFVTWKQITWPQQITNAKEINLATTDSGKIWIAFYQSPYRKPIPISDIYTKPQWVDIATMVDGHDGQPGNPVMQIANELKSFSIGITLMGTSNQVNENLQKPLMEVAGKQIALACQEIQRKVAEDLGEK